MRKAIRTCGHHDDTDFRAEFAVDDLGEPLRGIARRAAARRWPLVLGEFRGRHFLEVEMPAAGGTRVWCTGGAGADLPFEDHEFLAEFDGLWNRRLDVVEARVEWRAGPGYIRYLFSDPPANQVTVSDPETGAMFRLGPASAAARALLGITATHPVYTLRMTGMRPADGASADDLMRELGQTFLFQVGLRDGDAPSLVTTKRKESFFEPAAEPYRWPGELTFPRGAATGRVVNLFDFAATIPYPALRFLAYYQVIEYYYPRYSRLAFESVRSLRDSPEVDAATRRDLALVLDTMTKPGKFGWGNERTQLRATLAHCVEPAALTDLLRSMGESADESDERLLQQIGDRIYAVRNRIVHAKESPDAAPPPTDRALEPEIELVRFLAAAVLRADAAHP